MNRHLIFQRLLSLTASAALLIFGYAGMQTIINSIPDHISVEREELGALDFGIAVTEELAPKMVNASLQPSGAEHYEMYCKLLGILPIKTVDVQVVEEQSVYLGGIPIGLYLETQGVYVVDSGQIEGRDGKRYQTAKGLVEPGDYIVAVNDQPILEKEAFASYIAALDEDEVIVTIRRDDELIEQTLPLTESVDGSKKAGIWVRDNMQGIGTLTYVTEEGAFGALGHGLNDMDTGDLLILSEGALYETTIIEIKPGSSGSPGEVCGTIHYGNRFQYGTITQNTKIGIYGSCVADKLFLKHPKEWCQIGRKQEVRKGTAFLRSSVSGSIVDYEIEIIDLDYGEKDENKGILFAVKDSRLLETTGGIVQGMSGSPIIQDGKLVGAVTHVLVNDPTRGYGIFIENMLEAAE